MVIDCALFRLETPKDPQKKSKRISILKELVAVLVVGSELQVHYYGRLLIPLTDISIIVEVAHQPQSPC